jgi:hypothetical protein
MIGRLYHFGTVEASRRAVELVNQFDLNDAADPGSLVQSGNSVECEVDTKARP